MHMSGPEVDLHHLLRTVWQSPAKVGDPFLGEAVHATGEPALAHQPDFFLGHRCQFDDLQMSQWVTVAHHDREVIGSRRGHDYSL